MEAKELFEQAAKAWQNTEKLVREIVKTRAWQTLGHPNFITAWEAVSGVKCPVQVKIIATYAMFDTSTMNTNTRGFNFEPNGLLSRDVAEQIGWHVVYGSKANRKGTSPAVNALRRQHGHGVPADKATTSDTTRPGKYTASEAIRQHGTVPFTPPSRKRSRRTGAGPDDLVFEGFNVPRWEADAVAELSRQWDVPKAEVYRRLLTPQLEALRTIWDPASKAGVRT